MSVNWNVGPSPEVARRRRWRRTRGGILIQHDFPLNGQTNNAPPDCLIGTTFTYETGKYLDIAFRRLDDNNLFYFVARINGDLRLNRRITGSEVTLADSFGIFTDGLPYVLDVELTGSRIEAFVNGTKRISATDTFQQTQTGGLVWHNYVTNDIMLKVYS